MLNDVSNLSGILREFLHKGFVKTLIAFLMAGGVFVYCPNEYWISRIGEFMFFAMVYVGFFLMLLFLQWIWNRISATVDDSRVQGEMLDGLIDAVNNFYNNLSPYDQKIIDTFMENDNKPLLIAGERCYSDPCLLTNDKMMEKSRWSGTIEDIDKNKYWFLANSVKDLPCGFRPVGGIMQYKIKKRFFLQLKKVLQEQGKLGSF